MENFIRNNIITVGAGLASALTSTPGLASALASAPGLASALTSAPGLAFVPTSIVMSAPTEFLLPFLGRRILWADARPAPTEFLLPFLGRRTLGRTHIGGRRKACPYRIFITVFGANVGAGLASAHCPHVYPRVCPYLPTRSPLRFVTTAFDVSFFDGFAFVVEFFTFGKGYINFG